LVISVFEAKELNKEEIKNFPLTSNRLFHGPKCGGNVKMSEITESTNVLYCEKCGLRISYPSKIKKFGELQGWV